MMISEATRLAIEHHQAGRLEPAEHLYRQILAQDPDHADAWHLLGIIAHQVGKHEIAINYIERAIALNGDEAAFHNNLGEAYRALSNTAKAVACYRRALDLQPDYAAAHSNMGNALAEQGKLEEAVTCFDQALRLNPNYADAYRNRGLALQSLGKLDDAVASFQQAQRLNPDSIEVCYNLGNALQAQGKLDEAVAQYQYALRLQPDSAEMYFNLGNALQAQGKLDEAVAQYQQAVRLKPSFAEVYINAGAALQAQGKLTEALACFVEAIRLKPDSAEAYNNQGLVQKSQGKPAEAVASFDQALSLNPDDAEVYNNRGTALRMQGELDKAIASYQQALRLRPTFVEAWSNLGAALVSHGKVDDAAVLFRKAIEVNPRNPTFFYNLSELVAQNRCAFAPTEIAAMHALLEDENLPAEDRAQLHFALAAHCDSLVQFDEAFGHYRKANEFRQTHFHKIGRPFHADKHRRQVDTTIEFFDRAFLEKVKDIGGDATLPVFVLGMPRSGTTLVEQILASHPRVFGAGELADIEIIAARLPSLLNNRAAFPFCLRDMNTQQARRIAAQYVDRLRSLAGKGPDRVVDKLPGNFERLGLIATLFPRATIIHCKRDPRDVCLSCYCQNFVSLNFATSLDDIARYYLEYERLMKYWQQVLPIPIHDIQYETLVKEPETTCRQLIAACGLDWDDRCLAFYETNRPVQTASKLQVRQPIYRSSVARWKRYEAHLASLLAALEPSFPTAE